MGEKKTNRRLFVRILALALSLIFACGLAASCGQANPAETSPAGTGSGAGAEPGKETGEPAVTAEPSAQPTAGPGAEPTAEPTPEATPEVSAEPVLYEVQTVRDIAYLGEGGGEGEGERDEFHLLDVYDSTTTTTSSSSSANEELHPLIIEIHGGGLTGGSKDLNAPHSWYYARRGFNVITPNYTTMPTGTYKTIVQDLFALLDWLREHGEEYHCNLDEVFFSGDSAGGYIICLLAAVLHSPELQEYYEVSVPADINFRGYVLTCPMADQADLIRALDGEEENEINALYYAHAIGEEILRNEDIMNHALLTEIIDAESFPEVYITCTSDGGDPYYRDSVFLRDILEERGVPYVYQDCHGVEHELNHVFNVKEEQLDWVESIQANDDALAYMRGKCG